MAAGHLVAGLQLALHGDKHLHQLHHARRQFVAALQFFDLVVEATLEFAAALFQLLFEGFDLGHHLVVGDGDLHHLAGGQFLQHLRNDLGAGSQALGA